VHGAKTSGTYANGRKDKIQRRNIPLGHIARLSIILFPPGGIFYYGRNTENL
jgi:hypothetical protein